MIIDALVALGTAILLAGSLVIFVLWISSGDARKWWDSRPRWKDYHD